MRHQPGFFAPVGQVLFGGERSDAGAVRAALSAPPGRLLHVYGPTECTTFATCEEVRALSPDAATVPIGRAIGGTAARVLDPALAAGRRRRGGPALPRRPGARARLPRAAGGSPPTAFLPDPFATLPGQRMYRTGDLVRELADGALEFAGRIDNQVKVRGFRVELGEIEAALARHPALAAQVVEARRDAAGTPRLIAYLVPRSEPPSAGALRSFLAASLPDYLVPTGFQFLDALPLTPNGKIDRRALPAFDFSLAGAEGDLVAPRDELEIRLAAIFGAVLEAEELSITSSFFELGGHSLLAIQLLSRLRDQLGVELPMRALFEAPTIAGLAAAIREGAWRPRRRRSPSCRPTSWRRWRRSPSPRPASISSTGCSPNRPPTTSRSASSCTARSRCRGSAGRSISSSPATTPCAPASSRSRAGPSSW